jgi:hypothetical protein
VGSVFRLLTEVSRLGGEGLSIAGVSRGWPFLNAALD